MNKNTIFLILYLFIAIFCAIALTFQLGFATDNVVIIWPAAAINYWAIRRYGNIALAPVFFADACYTYLILGLSPLFLCISFGNMLAAWSGVFVEKKCLSNPAKSTATGNIFDSPNATYSTLVASFLTISLCSAFFGLFTIVFVNPDAEYPHLFLRWVLANYSGLIILAPALVYFNNYWKNKSLNSQSAINILACILVLTLMGLLVYYKVIDSQTQHLLVLLISPFVIWLAMQTNSERICLTLSAFGIATLAISLSLTTENVELTWQSNQLFITQSLLIGYILHTLNLQRNRLTTALNIEKMNLEQRVHARTCELENEIIQRKKVTAQLHHVASTDELTGIANRRAFFHSLDRELSRIHRGSSPLSLIMLDIDKFKLINDTYGHAAGDVVLQKLCECINQLIREKIDVFARLGGEEFAILLPETSIDGAQILAERCRVAIENMVVDITLDSGIRKQLNITSSFGAVECRVGDLEAPFIVAKADKALYQAKETGRNKLVLANTIQTLA